MMKIDAIKNKTVRELIESGEYGKLVTEELITCNENYYVVLGLQKTKIADGVSAIAVCGTRGWRRDSDATITPYDIGGVVTGRVANRLFIDESTGNIVFPTPYDQEFMELCFSDDQDPENDWKKMTNQASQYLAELRNEIYDLVTDRLAAKYFEACASVEPIPREDWFTEEGWPRAEYQNQASRYVKGCEPDLMQVCRDEARRNCKGAVTTNGGSELVISALIDREAAVDALVRRRVSIDYVFENTVQNIVTGIAMLKDIAANTPDKIALKRDIYAAMKRSFPDGGAVQPKTVKVISTYNDDENSGLVESTDKYEQLLKSTAEYYHGFENRIQSISYRGTIIYQKAA